MTKQTFRISQINIAKKVCQAKSIYLDEPNSLYFTAAKRLDIMMKGTAVDIFAAVVFYHKSCFQSFTYIRKKDEADPLVEFVFDYFRNCTELKICKKKMPTFRTNFLMT